MLERLIIFIKKLLKIIYSFFKKFGVSIKSILLFVLVFLKKLIFIDKKEGEQGGGILETIKNIFIALILAIIIRSFLYEPFHIPSGSMKPNLKEGDFIFVSKYDFGYSRYSFPFGLPLFKDRIFFKKQPKRGDVLVFRLPSNPKINYIKRLIGLPGDKIQMKDGILFINNEPISKTFIKNTLEFEDEVNSKAKEYKEKLQNGKEYLVLDKFENGNGDNTAVFTVPDKHYFFLGDNRDNSLDSRFKETGFIPEENLIGKARIIFFSTSDNPLKFWKWNKIIRIKRIFSTIK